MEDVYFFTELNNYDGHLYFIEVPYKLITITNRTRTIRLLCLSPLLWNNTIAAKKAIRRISSRLCQNGVHVVESAFKRGIISQNYQEYLRHIYKADKLILDGAQIEIVTHVGNGKNDLYLIDGGSKQLELLYI